MDRVLNFIIMAVVIFVAIVVTLDSIRKNNAEQTSLTPPVKHELNFTSPNPKSDVLVSDAFGECDSEGTETTKTTVDVCEIAPIPVSATVFVATKEYKFFGLTVWKSKKVEMGRE